jgi:chemotaxis signal transduction protein
MLKSSPGPTSKGPQNVSIVMFSIGGQRLAAKAEEVGGIWPWTEALPIPSGTPHVGAVLRRGADVLPVFDLAGKLGREVEGATPFCLIVRHADGPLAIRIDGAMPTLQSVETARIRPSKRRADWTTTTCRFMPSPNWDGSRSERKCELRRGNG